MSRIANSLVHKYKQYQSLQRLLQAEKPTKSATDGVINMNATISITTPNYAELLTFNLAEYMQDNTPPPPPSLSPLEQLKHSLLHKSPLSETSPPMKEEGEAVERDAKIKELAQRILELKRMEIQAESSTTHRSLVGRETLWKPLVSSDEQNKFRRKFHTDDAKDRSDQFVEIITKDKRTRLSTGTKNNETIIVYAKSAPKTETN
uniref:Uncharacterized protein n=1 Tax=Cacopsylla melanoneura TaxID=428564 RepID=A0A8D8VVG8_9HEMI